MKCIYLDYNATTPICKEVAEAMLPCLLDQELQGNPSSSHYHGRKARQLVDVSRQQIADFIGADSIEEILFTSGGTESNNTALRGVKPKILIRSAVEHPAISCVGAYMEKEFGTKVVVIPVDMFGLLCLDALEKALAENQVDDGNVLVSVMLANNEVGAIQPIRLIADLAHKYGALVHCDAAQACGKIPVNVKDLDVDFLSIAGHKMYAPKGVGALYVRKGVAFEKLMHGANHESDRRAGTENVLLIVGLGKAAEIAKRDMDQIVKHTTEMRNLLRDELLAIVPEGRPNGRTELTLPNTLSITFKGVYAVEVLNDIDGKVSASAGAACHSGTDKSHVVASATLNAMGFLPECSIGTLRLSVGRDTTAEEVKAAAKIIGEAVKKRLLESK